MFALVVGPAAWRAALVCSCRHRLPNGHGLPTGHTLAIPFPCGQPHHKPGTMNTHHFNYWLCAGASCNVRASLLQGTFTLANGNKYVGQWADAKYNGKVSAGVPCAAVIWPWLRTVVGVAAAPNTAGFPVQQRVPDCCGRAPPFWHAASAGARQAALKHAFFAPLRPWRES